MVETKEQIIFIITSVLVLLMAFTVIVLFVVFQRRKNKLLEAQKEAKKRFENEIAKTQIEIREETLRNISWELHDNIGQLLTLAKIQIQTATKENVKEVSETISKGLNEVRLLSKLINPEIIKNIQLKEAIQLEIDRFNRLNFIASNLYVIGEEQPIDEKAAIIIFRILQEFFSNTIKHSKASKLNVILDFKKNELNIKAEDDGIGFNADTIKSKGIGLSNIKSRAALIKAEINLTSKNNKGTTLIINYRF
ncbi:sensor histidine kinase [Tenacibaculum sp. UWU-22]|uniref:sensor histidine kinase n=1 Tax=Tenacibaculum sp. UWU-22 TaxID=3234187 RepID=UPI0034DADD98